MGGIFNTVNLHLYHYAGNNPVKYVDPDGRQAEIAAEVAVEVVIVVAVVVVATVNLIKNAIKKTAEIFSRPNTAPISATQAGADSSEAPSVDATPSDKKNKREVEHAQKRYDEARAGDSHRDVGDANRVTRDGKRFYDNDTGNDIYVDGNRVVVVDQNGEQVSQFKNPKANTVNRVNEGRWVPYD